MKEKDKRKDEVTMSLFDEKCSAVLKDTGILPVVCLKNESELRTFMSAVMKSPVRCIEITLRHPFALDAITRIKEKHPEVTVGAGTVTSAEKLDLAIRCGADFCVAPGTAEDLIAASEKRNMPFLPGVSTPSEILKVSALGYKVVKYFPAELSGGIKALRLYEGAFADTVFLPTGGITLENLPEYLKCKNVLACGGSFMLPATMLAKGDSEGIYNTIISCLRKG